VRSLQAEPDAKRWTLVLPRWNARHWQDKQAGLPWSAFFELVPLREYVAPVGVVEFDEFAAYRAGCNRAATVDRVLHLVRDIPDDWSKPHPKFTAVDCSADSEQLYSIWLLLVEARDLWGGTANHPANRSAPVVAGPGMCQDLWQVDCIQEADCTARAL
jgi:hypothetical protein